MQRVWKGGQGPEEIQWPVGQHLSLPGDVMVHWRRHCFFSPPLWGRRPVADCLREVRVAPVEVGPRRGVGPQWGQAHLLVDDCPPLWKAPQEPCKMPPHKCVYPPGTRRVGRMMQLPWLWGSLRRTRRVGRMMQLPWWRVSTCRTRPVGKMLFSPLRRKWRIWRLKQMHQRSAPHPHRLLSQP